MKKRWVKITCPCCKYSFRKYYDKPFARKMIFSLWCKCGESIAVELNYLGEIKYSIVDFVGRQLW